MEILDHQIVEIKKPALLLSVAEQFDGIVLYALVDELEDNISIDVRIIGTGNSIKDNIENYKF